MLPALFYMFIISVIFAFATSFAAITGNELLVLSLFVVLSFITDNSAGIIGAKYGGAHTKSLLWGIGGSILGTFFLPFLFPFGSLIGLFSAVFIAEIYYLKNHTNALKSASGAFLGGLAGIVVNVFIAIGFITTFIFFVLKSG